MSEELSDEALLAMFADEVRRHYAFNLIVHKHQRRLYSFVRRMVTDPDETQDVLQNTFIKAWKGLPDFRGDSQLYSWLYRIAHNESISHLARMRRGLFTTDERIFERLTGTLDSTEHFNGDAIQQKLHAPAPQAARRVHHALLRRDEVRAHEPRDRHQHRRVEEQLPHRCEEDRRVDHGGMTDQTIARWNGHNTEHHGTAERTR